MVNRGDGGGKRPTPPSARPAPRAPARPAADDGEEKTSAINLADINLDELDAPSAPAKKPVPPPRPRAAAVDEDNEKTNAINLADVNLDDLDASPSRAPARPQPSGRPAPARPAPASPKPSPRASDPEDEEKTSAVSSKDVAAQLEALKQRRAAAAAPAAPPEPARQAPPARPAPAQVPAPKPPVREEPPKVVSPPPKKEEVIERTMAVSLEEIEAKVPKAALPKGKADPAAADRTYVVGDDEPEAAPAPQPKRLPAALAAKMNADSAPPTAKTSPSKSPSKEAAEAEPKLAVRGGPDQGKSFPLTKDLTLVGRGLDADIVINDASASRKHFNIVRTLSGWKLVDLGSGNGTKIDGIKVSEVALKHGMRIDLGATTLEFVFEEGQVSAPAQNEAPKPVGRGTVTDEAKPPERKQRNPARLDAIDEDLAALKASAKGPADEEKTSFGDIASLQIDPAWEARRTKQRRDGDEVKSSESTSEVEAAEAPRRSGAGKKIAIAGAVVALLGGGFVAADKFAGLGIIFPKTAPTQVSTGSTSGSTDKEKSPKEDPKANDGQKEDKVSEEEKKKKAKEAEAKNKEGDDAYKERRYIAALASYRAAIELDPLVDGAEGGIDLIKEEFKAAGDLIKVIGLQAEGKHAEAAKIVGSIGKSLSMKVTGEKYLEAAREEAVPALFLRASELLEKRDFAGAKDVFDLGVKLAGAELEPTDVKSVIAAYKDALDRGLAKDAEMSDADPSVKGEPADLKAAFEAYAKGDVSTAINELDRLQDPAKKVSKADVGKSMAYSGAATLVDERTKAAKGLGDKLEEMMPVLRVARLADALLGGLQRKQLEASYAKTLVPALKKAVDAKDFHLAALLANFILVTDPAQADAKAALEATTKAGKDTLAEAKKAQKDDPDKALTLGLEALRLLPASDPDQAEAKKLILELAKAE